MVFLSLPLIKLPSCKATSFRIWVHTSYVVACGIQPKAFFFIIYILLTVNLKSLSTIMCRSRSNHVPWGKGFIHSAMTRLEGMREFSSSGKDVSVNVVIIPRIWGTVSSDGRRSPEEGIHTGRNCFNLFQMSFSANTADAHPWVSGVSKDQKFCEKFKNTHCRVDHPAKIE